MASIRHGVQVRQEVGEQSGRLASHPSIVIWGGNNEVEASLEWYNATRAHRDRNQQDYAALFLDTVQQALLKV